MGMTTFNRSTNPALVRSVLSRKAFLWAQKNMFFMPFVSKQSNADNDTRTGGMGKKGVEATKSANALITLR